MAHGIPARLVVAVPLLLALGGTIHAARLFQQDLLFTDVETELGFWGRKEYHPEAVTIQRVEEKLHRLMERSPDTPQYLVMLARYAAWRGYWSDDIEIDMQYNQQAVQAQFAALESRPAHRHSWAKMLQYSSRIQDGKPMRSRAQAQLQALRPTPDPDEP